MEHPLVNPDSQNSQRNHLLAYLLRAPLPPGIPEQIHLLAAVQSSSMDEVIDYS